MRRRKAPGPLQGSELPTAVHVSAAAMDGAQGAAPLCRSGALRLPPSAAHIPGGAEAVPPLSKGAPFVGAASYFLINTTPCYKRTDLARCILLSVLFKVLPQSLPFLVQARGKNTTPLGSQPPR